METVFHLPNVNEFVEKHNGQAVLVATWPDEMRIDCHYQNGTLDHAKYYHQGKAKPCPIENMSDDGIPSSIPCDGKVIVSGIIRDDIFLADHIQEGVESILDAWDKPTDQVFERLKYLGFKVPPSIKLNKGDILLEKVLLMQTFAKKEGAMLLLQHSYTDKIAPCGVVDHRVIKNYIHWSWSDNLETYTVP